MTPTQMARRSDALYADGTCGMTRRVLCDMVAQRESDIDELQKLVRDALACVHESSRGFRTRPKTYRDLYSRAKKLGVDE